MPLFVHPGPACDSPAARPPVDEPPWWRALTDYVAQMQAAWLTFMTHGRRDHPELIVVFALLAGCAPLLAERLAVRGGPAVDLREPHTFYETSSYGVRAIEAVGRLVGIEQLVLGSDRPVVEPPWTGHEPVLSAAAGRLLERAEVVA